MAKTLVITGATKGIGKACAYRFAKEGINIAFTYNSNEEIAKDIAKDLEAKFGIKARYYPYNILEPETAKELFLAIDEDFDTVDYFISNAMIYGRAVIGGYNKFMKLKKKIKIHLCRSNLKIPATLISTRKRQPRKSGMIRTAKLIFLSVVLALVGR